jgi:glycosyltransferase involved in cell wall biosynthesis
LPQGALARCPVITYDIDGNREGLIDGATGFLLPSFDKSRLAQALETLLANPDQRRRMGDAGREFALSRFGAAVMIDALEKVYAQARNV